LLNCNGPFTSQNKSASGLIPKDAPQVATAEIMLFLLV